MNWLASWLPPRLIELIRFYQAAVVNTLFGLSLFYLLLWLSVNPYVAQAIAHVCGIAFNYLTYSRHVFRDAAPAKLRFVAAYGVNYLVSLACLALFKSFITSNYVAGLFATITASLVNYFALRHGVFVGQKPQ